MTRFSSKFGLSLFYLIVTIGLDILTFMMLGIGYIPEHFLYNMGLILMFMGIIFVIPNYLAQYIVSMIFIIAQTVLLYVNYTLYHLYGEIFSFDMIKLINETKQAITRDFTYVWLIIFLVALVIMIGTVGFIIYKALRVYKIPFRNNFSVFIVMIFLIVQGIGATVYGSQSQLIHETANVYDENYVLSDAFLMDTTMLKMASLKSLGTYGYYVNNIMNLLSSTGSKSIIDPAVEYFSSGEIYDGTKSNVFGIDEGNNLIIVMMESLEWFAFSDGTLNSKNLNNELTPNINRLINEGIIATDFFSKSKTNISEGIGFLGSYPIGKYMEQVAGTSSREKDYGFSLPQVLNRAGYETEYLHSNIKTYYGRNKTHGVLGFNNRYFGDDAIDSKIHWGEWMKEEDFVRTAMDEGYLIPENAKNGEKFFSFYTTVSTHGPYVDNHDNSDQREYKDLVESSVWYQNMIEAYSNSEMQNYLVNYEAATVGLDRALGAIIERLEEDGIYDKTDILLYADHNAYYHTLSNYIKGVDSENYSDIELNTVPFILKSNGLKEKLDEVGYYSAENPNGLYLEDNRYKTKNLNDDSLIVGTSRFCSAYDILPTILDLFGIEFNVNFYPGNSLFSTPQQFVQIWDGEGINTDPVFAYYSHTGGIYGKYGNTKDMEYFEFVYPENSVGVDARYNNIFKSVAKELLRKLNFVSTLYSYGVYSKLEPV